MKAVLCALILIPCAQVFAQGTAAEWFPTAVGNQWLYQHEVRDSPKEYPTSGDGKPSRRSRAHCRFRRV